MKRRIAVALSVLPLLLGGVPSVAPPPAAATSGLARTPASLSAASQDIRPLVVVLDTSGSMDDPDDNGTIKLAGAQVALSSVIRQQRPGARIGLYTYPGTEGGCDPGSFAVPVQDLDQREMISTIRGLTASGDTPTGEALRAAVDQLTAEGYDGATILLISDGLHTCDADPCAVAQEVTAEGFDLTVQAAGFQISDEGLEELRCIAEATGGQTLEATDSDELNEVVAEATRAALTMTLEGMPESVPAGSARRVRVTVTNDSAVDIENARVSLTFTSGATGRQAVVPPVLPPLIRVGNLPAGASREHTWLVSFGTRGAIGRAGWRLAAWGTNAQPTAQAGSVEVQDLIQDLSDAGGQIAELQGERIAVLGDSYSSGEGAGTYDVGSDGPCHRSSYTYLYSLFGDDDVDLLACSGATTRYRDDETNGVQEDQVDELARRQERNGAVSAAFLTIGGNDIGFSSIIGSCLVLHPTTFATWFGDVPDFTTRCSDDTAWKDEIFANVEGLAPDLATTYREVYAQLNRADFVEERDGRIAPLYVLAYPQPFPERQFATSCPGFDLEEVAFANDLLQRLNDRIARSVAGLRKEGYRVHMIGDTEETFLPDNTACPRPGATEYLHSITALDGVLSKLKDAIFDTELAQEFMHPNALGYQAETSTIMQWSVTADGDLPDDVDAWRPGDDDGWWSQVIDPVTIARALTPTLPSAGRAVFDATARSFVSAPGDARGGQPLDVEVRGATPGSTVQVLVASRPQLLGSVEVGADGTGTGRMVLPRTLASGTHVVTALGFDARGNPSMAATELDVARALPFWWLPLAVLTVLSFAAALLLGRRARRESGGERLSGTG